MPRFMLLAYDRPDDFAGLSPDEMQAIIDRYTAWTESVRQTGGLLASEKLVDGEARRLAARDGRVIVRDGPFVESREVLGGYWLIEARDYDEAQRIAAGCPHVELGVLEIRAVEALP